VIQVLEKPNRILNFEPLNSIRNYNKIGFANQLMNTKVQRLFHPNGVLRAEIPLQNSRPHGLRRDRHPNGIIAAEIPFENGLQHGVARAWASDGRLLGEYSMDQGVGVYKAWYENGTLSQELDAYKGLPHGRQKCWDENGDFVAEAYYVMGKKVSKRKYLEACRTAPNLPQYSKEEST
jgi:antitoxin component YwqK of YwqJK toxin-antitoxin module